MKRLLAMTVSNIAHIYRVFPEECFSDRLLDGVKIKVLYGTRRKESEVNQMIRWLKGANDAIDKKYVSHKFVVVAEIWPHLYCQSVPGEIESYLCSNRKDMPHDHPEHK